MNHDGNRSKRERRDRLRERVADIYTNGATISATAQKIGCSRGTIRVLLKEAGVSTRAHDDLLPARMITTREAAVISGMSHRVFSQECAHGQGPKQAEQPPTGHSHYRYFWRQDVEEWTATQRKRKAERQRLKQVREAARANSAPLQQPDYVPKRAALLEAIDAKRSKDALHWADVALAAGIDPARISRIRAGYVAGWALYFRLTAWLHDGELPLELQAVAVPRR
ncbi:hypothetical protein OG875_05090 [Streptomyces sp. NBC_01498]|uniref:helix-turn-helix domain-containing protein n=1 Tax=Streptomyces sp. NBC_01498 TaxID=2975870 RepID=UPI002E7B2437|nr:hypothetical protein [Streptomyces sp. NBC_01498]WTL24033.1 hypothetical protein OG875_05090 [Streptomyces sp. NBC_01498]